MIKPRLAGGALPQKQDLHLDRVSTGSGSDLVKLWKFVRDYNAEACMNCHVMQDQLRSSVHF